VSTRRASIICPNSATLPWSLVDLAKQNSKRSCFRDCVTVPIYHPPRNRRWTPVKTTSMPGPTPVEMKPAADITQKIQGFVPGLIYQRSGRFGLILRTQLNSTLDPSLFYVYFSCSAIGRARASPGWSGAAKSRRIHSLPVPMALQDVGRADTDGRWILRTVIILLDNPVLSGLSRCLNRIASRSWLRGARGNDYSYWTVYSLTYPESTTVMRRPVKACTV
jgi:hypothetical protein